MPFASGALTRITIARENLVDLTDEISNLTDITVNDENYAIQYFLGGDWKFLALVCGIGRAMKTVPAHGLSVQKHND